MISRTVYDFVKFVKDAKIATYSEQEGFALIAALRKGMLSLLFSLSQSV